MSGPYEHSGGAQDARLVGDFLKDAVALTIDVATDWPTGASHKFWVAIDPDTPLEEHLLVNARTGTAMSLSSSADRGLESTTNQDHKSGAIVRHIFSATEADDMALRSAVNAFTAASNSFGEGAGGGAGTYVTVGSLGDPSAAYVAAHSSTGNAHLALRPVGTGSVQVQRSDGTQLANWNAGVVSPGATVLSVMYHNGTATTVQIVTCGPADSGGTGFKALRVPN